MKKFSIANQLNMIEMISSVYFESGFTISDIAQILNRKRRTVYRYLKSINDFAPIILTYVDSDDKTHLKLMEKISEKTVDLAFSKNQTMPLIYLFLLSLCREIKIADIEIMFKCSKNKAIKMRNHIFNTTNLGNIEHTDEDLDTECE